MYHNTIRMTKKAILVILDGWGHGTKDNTNAIHLANTPFIDSLYKDYPNTELVTYGEDDTWGHGIAHPSCADSGAP